MKPELIDIGVNLTHRRFATDRDAVIARARAAGVSAMELDAYLALDLHVGITGWICDERRGVALRSLIARIPPDRLMIETDAPFLLPRDLADRPQDGRNEPGYLPNVLAAVARGAGRPLDVVATETTRTARAFFAIA